MAMYEYKCEECGHLFDRIQKFSDPNPLCPNKGLRVTRSFEYRGFTLPRGFAVCRELKDTTNVLVPSADTTKLHWSAFDLSDFIDGEGNPSSGLLDHGYMVDPETGELLDSLEGYAQWGVCEGKTERLISSGSFILKGGGWFKDGYS